MKKIYSLLLLSALLTLGASNAWAAYYYRGDANSWGKGIALESAGTNLWKKTVSLTKQEYHNFKISAAEDDWNAAQYNFNNVDFSRSNVYINKTGGEYDYNIGIYSPRTVSATIYLDDSNSDDIKVYVVVADFYNVTVYLATDYARNLYAYYTNNGNDTTINGAWGGRVSSDVEEIAGVNYYKYLLGVPKEGYSLTFIVNNKSDNSHESSTDTQTGNIYPGVITKDTTIYYNFGSHLYYWTIRGDFTNWKDMTEYMAIGLASEVSIPLSASVTPKFQFYNGTWYGNSGTITSDANSKEFETGNSTSDCTLSTTIAGYYNFELTGWTDSKANLTVVYPVQHSRTDLAAGAYGTVCLPGKSHVNYVTNATIYSIAGKRVDGSGNPTSVVLVEETGELVAGRPYIFQVKEAGNVTINHTGSESAGAYNGLHGTLVAMSNSADDLVGMYVLVNTQTGGQVRKVTSGATVTVAANRAYFDLTSNEASGGAPVYSGTPAPGRRYMEMPLAPENATALEDVEANENVVKFFENGNLYILRDGVTYDVMGRVVR